MKRFSLGLFIILLSIGLSGCGGGGDSSSEPVTVSGKFIDAPVEGLDYECSSGKNGTTNSTGLFICNSNDNVTFKVGEVIIGSTTIGDIITPFHLYPTDIEKAYNVSQLLHSLDDDSNPDNNIKLLKNIDLTGVNIAEDSNTFQNALASALASHSRTNFNRDEAKAKMLSYIKTNSSNNYGLSIDIDNELSLLETLMCSNNETLINGVCGIKVSEGDIDKIKWDYNDIKDKSDYETDLEYETRMNDFIDSQGILTFTITLYDQYDINTQVLEVYSGGSEGYIVESPFIYGRLKDDRDYLQIYNFNDFSFDITYTSNLMGTANTSPKMTFYKTTISPTEAENLNGKFYATVKVKPKIMIESPNSFKNKEVVYTSCGSLYCTSSLYVDLVSIEIYNSSNTVLYGQDSISTLE